ncbi:MAG: hypothetical protein HY909_04130 [Deltaproteobacteria bacterium]|nr:hypothetical protein [Deltaproteobacteria bacterium]
MTDFGRNLKLSIDLALRDAVRRFYEEGFGASRRPLGDSMDQFTLADGFSLGVSYVSAAQALPESAWEWAPWLEFRVDDVPGTTARLLGLGAVTVAFRDTTHPYLRGPGGPVFRLCSRV